MEVKCRLILVLPHRLGDRALLSSLDSCRRSLLGTYGRCGGSGGSEASTSGLIVEGGRFLEAGKLVDVQVILDLGSSRLLCGPSAAYQGRLWPDGTIL